MTTKRQVPLTGDTLAWVHKELAELKARLSVVQQAAEQSRNLATDAAEKAHQLRSKVDQVEALGPALSHLQEDLRIVRDQLARLQDDVSGLRLSRDEAERRALVDSERERQERSETGRHFAELQRLMDAWQERIAGFEEQNRRNLETVSQATMKLEATDSELTEANVRQSRSLTTLNRLDEDVARVKSAIGDLGREDNVQRERVQSALEMLRRLESESEAMKGQLNRVDRIDDRLELVQAERSRHGERLNEFTVEMDAVSKALADQAERASLIEARISGYQDDLKAMNAKLVDTRDQLVAYLHGLGKMETEFRKRHMAALEKELRDIRSKSIGFGDE